MRTGDAFTLKAIGAWAATNFWIILSDPDIDPEHVLVVKLTTWKPYKDQACVVEPGAHEFVRHRACVDYRKVRVVTLAQLQRLKDRGVLEALPPLSSALLFDVRYSVFDSRFIALDHLALLERQGLDDIIGG